MKIERSKLRKLPEVMNIVQIFFLKNYSTSRLHVDLIFHDIEEFYAHLVKRCGLLKVN